MENMILLEPDISFAKEILSYRQDFLDSGENMDGCSFLETFTHPEQWLEHNTALKSENIILKGLVPSIQYIYVRQSDKKIVGMIQFRRGFSKYINKYYGNIGYSVRPKERRKGYAKDMLEEILKKCKEIGFNKVLVTCQKGNIGSKKTILANGGVYESSVYEPDEKVVIERYFIKI